MMKTWVRQSRQYIQYGIGLLSMSAVFYYLFQHKDSLNVITDFSFMHLSAMLGLTLIINVIYAEKVLAILKQLNLGEISRYEWLKIFFMSRFINLHVPQGALFYRSYQLKQRFNFSYASSLSVTATYSLLETVVVLVVGFIALTILNLFTPQLPIEVFVILGSFCLALLAVPAALVLCKSQFYLIKSNWLANRARDFSNSFTLSFKSHSLLKQLTLMNLLTLALQFIWMQQCFLAIGLSHPASYIFLYVIVLQLSGTVRILPGNWGVTELVCGALAVFLGLDFSNGLIISLLTRLVVYCAFMLIGIFYCITERFCIKTV
ncbi:hypothetical protein Shal_2294 [Shewanella halifaxensis HAW-EB4]|uniref:Uncharacterized protein n=1 Tax=Shewanella halifaxensis (strain HAW-EB4) TaxID=458817 RepID=B0TVG8_SHEHH|nr:lysylphosphatidylglycerol synthase domain-containing protein [Shewanella halifaxensis]ABZ76853.1 hypothetical protein Shal_2294 [Shewanella halifaxensis HAW-EB4]